MAGVQSSVLYIRNAKEGNKDLGSQINDVKAYAEERGFVEISPEKETKIYEGALVLDR